MSSELGDDERRLHPAGIAVVAVGHMRSAAVGAIALVAGLGPRIGTPLVAALIVIAGVAAYVEWRSTRYAIVEGGLRLRRGVFSRREVTVPATRISALDTSRGVLQRIFGVVALQVQTAGGGEHAELVLGAVTPAEAERVRLALGHRGTATAHARLPADAAATGADDSAPQFVRAAEPAADAGEVIATITVRQLLLAGLTSPSIAVVGAGIAAVAGPAQDLADRRLASSLQAEAEQIASTAPLVLAAGALALAIAGSIIGTALAYYGFQITRDDRRLRLRRGLLTERTDTVPIDRVHAVRIVEQPLRQLIGYVSIEAEVAGWAAQDQTVRTLVPFVRREDLPALLPRLLPGYAWPSAPLRGVPRRATRRYVIPLLWVAVPAAAALGLAPLGAWRLGLAAAVLVATVAFGVMRARDAGWLEDGELLVLRARSVSRTTVIARRTRIQQREVSTTPLQARAALATFGVRLSSRRHVTVRHLEERDAGELFARLQVPWSARPEVVVP